jgi:hypothetical protein
MKLFKNYTPRMLRDAIEIELQKAGSTVVAARIALQRLEDDPEYYTKMQKAVMTKYIRKEPDGSGGWKYFYKEKQAQPVTKCQYCNKYEHKPGEWKAEAPKDLDPKNVTHGPCPDCFRKELAKIEDMTKALGDMRPGHKYIKRTPKSTGKGFNYFYNKAEYDQFKQQKQGGWLSKISEFFGFKNNDQAMQRIVSDYKDHDIAGKYSLSWDGWKDHVSEYFEHKDKWDGFFSKKKESKPTQKKKIKLKITASVKKERRTGERLQLNVMREVYNIYGEKKTEEIKEKESKIENKYEKVYNDPIPNNLEEAESNKWLLYESLENQKILFDGSHVDLSRDPKDIELTRRMRESMDKLIKKLNEYNQKIYELKIEKKKEKEVKSPEDILKKIDIESAVRSPHMEKPGGWVEGSGTQGKDFQDIEVYYKLNHMSPGDIEKLFEDMKLDSTADLSSNLKSFTKMTDKELDILIVKALGKDKAKEYTEQKVADKKISAAINAVIPETRHEIEREVMGIPDPPEVIQIPKMDFKLADTKITIPYYKGGQDQQVTAKDYSTVIPRDIYLVSDKNILTESKPKYIPDIDESFFKSNKHILPIYKMEENKYLVLVNQKRNSYTIREKTTVGEEQYVVVNQEVLAAMHDYYLKKIKAEQKKESQDATSRYKKKRIAIMSDNRMSYAESDLIKSFIGNIPRYDREGMKKVWEHYNIVRQDLKQKTQDMEIQIEEYYNTHAKGRETAYGDKGLKDNLLSDYGVKVKRQNGAEINDIEISEIKNALTDIYQVFGNRSEMSKNFGLKISHSGEVLQHARSASGLFFPSMKAIGVTAKYGEKGTGFILAHEFGHFMDYYVGEKTGYHYSSDNPENEAGQIASIFRKNMIEKQTSKYQNRTCECFARALEQYWAIKSDNLSIMKDWDKSNHLTEVIFKEKLMPLIDIFFKNNEKMLKSFTAGFKNSDKIFRYKNKIIRIKK